jgi:hypothetical protein
MRWATVAVVVVVAAAMALLIRPPIKDPALAHELISMQREIDKYALQFTGSARPNLSDLSDALRNKQRDAALVDKAHADRLAQILDEQGWPTKNQVGGEAALAAMNVVGRAQDVGFKVRALGLMQKAGVKPDAQYARLVDMVAVIRGEPQTYGTQWNCENGAFKLVTPLKDPNRAQQLRREAGLPAFDKFAAAFCAEPGDNRPVIIRQGP